MCTHMYTHIHVYTYAGGLQAEDVLDVLDSGAMACPLFKMKGPQMQVLVCVDTHVSLFVCVCTYVHVNIYIYIYIYIYIF